MRNLWKEYKKKDKSLINTKKPVVDLTSFATHSGGIKNYFTDSQNTNKKPISIQDEDIFCEY